MIKAVLFDMDGILFDTEIVMKEGWLKAARELNFTLTEEHLSQMRGSALPRSRKLFEEWFHGEVTYDEGRAIRSAYLNDYIQRNGVPEKPGLHEFLSWLKEHSIKVAVATSTTRRVAEGYWKQSGIDQYIDASVCGDEVVNSKPAPEIFLKAASLLQVPIAECMVAEDSINGLKAARASGAVSCMIPDLTPYTEELAPICDHVSPSLLDRLKNAEDVDTAATSFMREYEKCANQGTQQKLRTTAAEQIYNVMESYDSPVDVE